MHPHKPAKNRKGNLYSSFIRKRSVIRLVVLGLLVYLVIAGFSGLGESIQAIRSADSRWLLFAVTAVIASYFFAAVTYTLLAGKKIEVLPTFLVQIAGGLVNRLLPGGLGGMGLNALYLKKAGFHLPVASTIVAINNSLGFIGNVLLLLVAALFFPMPLPAIGWPEAGTAVIILTAVLIVILTVAVLIRFRFAQPLRRGLNEAGRYFKAMCKRPGYSSAALLSSCILTSLHVAALHMVLLSIGIEGMVLVSLLAISTGALVGAVVPTPGGIGGAEAGIAAALITLSVPSVLAVSAALIYRGITYWMPLLPGYVALRVVEKRYL